MQRVTHISQLDLSKQYTYADYLTWWFEERVELIKGFVRQMSAAPSVRHQVISGKLYLLIGNFLKKKDCCVFYAPFDVRLTRVKKDIESITVVQPDICIVCNPEILDEKGCNGAPDMIIEILSLTNNKHDLVTKFQLYEEAKVSEYWVVHPFEGNIDVFHLENNKYVLHKKYFEDETIDVKTLPGLTIDMMDVFED